MKKYLPTKVGVMFWVSVVYGLGLSIAYGRYRLGACCLFVLWVIWLLFSLREMRAFRPIQLSSAQRRLNAYHEACHLVCAWRAPDNSHRLISVTIVPRGNTGGGVAYSCERVTSGTEDHLAWIASLLAPTVALEKFGFPLNDGGMSDIAVATECAEKMVCEYGMSPALGPRCYNLDDTMLSASKLEVIDREVDRVLTEGKALAAATIEAHRSDVERVAEALLKRETLSYGEIETMLGPRSEPSDRRSRT